MIVKKLDIEIGENVGYLRSHIDKEILDALRELKTGKYTVYISDKKPARSLSQIRMLNKGESKNSPF